MNFLLLISRIYRSLVKIISSGGAPPPLEIDRITNRLIKNGGIKVKRIIIPTEGFDRYVAQIFAQQVLQKPDSTLCFATGDTTENIFKELVRIKNELGIDFSQIKAVNLDEYVGVQKESPTSCYYRICRDLYTPLGISKFYVPIASADEAEGECVRFEKVINDFGGIDMMLLSVGTNGHIAFNEPGTPWALGIHIAEISASTVVAKSTLFGGAENVPKYGVTMGVSTVMQAQKIIMVAKGAHKKEIMKAILDGQVTPDVPGSVMQLHPNVITILDDFAGDV